MSDSKDCLLVNTITGKVFYKGFLRKDIMIRWSIRKNAAVLVWDHRNKKYKNYTV